MRQRERQVGEPRREMVVARKQGECQAQRGREMASVEVDLAMTSATGRSRGIRALSG